MKSHLSAVHTGLETSYTPAVPLFRPPPPPCLYFTPNVNGSFLDKKKERERKKKRKGDTGRNKEATARGACFTGSGGTVRAAVTAGRESQPKPRLSFSPLWLL